MNYPKPGNIKVAKPAISPALPTSIQKSLTFVSFKEASAPSTCLLIFATLCEKLCGALRETLR
jgi:hypothetical protein